jgi:UDP-glucose 4-epimerase
VQRPFIVTGGAGFIGSHLVERLLQDGHPVVVIDNLSTGSADNLAHLRSHPGLEFVQASVSSCPDLDHHVARSRGIFHLAAAVGVEWVLQHPIDTIHINLDETRRVLESAVRHRTPVLLTSTSEVYGRSDKPWFSEDDDLVIGPPTIPRWSYACSKLLDEFLALAHHRDQDLPVVVVRLFNIVGPRQSSQHGMVLPRFVQAALSGRPLVVHGDGSQTRCFCHVNDCVEALVRLQGCPQAVGEVINVGTDEEIPMIDLAHRVRDLTRSPSPIERVPYATAMGNRFQDMPRRRPDLRKLARLTDFRPGLTLEKTILDLMTFESGREPSGT